MCGMAFRPAGVTQPERSRYLGLPRAAAGPGHTRLKQQGWALPSSLEALVLGSGTRAGPLPYLMQLTLGVPQESNRVPVCLEACHGADGLLELQHRLGLQGLAASDGARGVLISAGVRLWGVLDGQGGEAQSRQEAGGTFPGAESKPRPEGRAGEPCRGAGQIDQGPSLRAEQADAAEAERLKEPLRTCSSLTSSD